MVEFFLGMYGLIIFGVIILALGSWFIWDKRYKRVERPEIPEGFVRTNEIFIDPTTKKKNGRIFSSRYRRKMVQRGRLLKNFPLRVLKP